jgi:hypothetical protein
MASLGLGARGTERATWRSFRAQGRAARCVSPDDHRPLTHQFLHHPVGRTEIAPERRSVLPVVPGEVRALRVVVVSALGGGTEHGVGLSCRPERWARDAGALERRRRGPQRPRPERADQRPRGEVDLRQVRLEPLAQGGGDGGEQEPSRGGAGEEREDEERRSGCAAADLEEVEPGEDGGEGEDGGRVRQRERTPSGRSCVSRWKSVVFVEGASGIRQQSR